MFEALEEAIEEVESPLTSAELTKARRCSIAWGRA